MYVNSMFRLRAALTPTGLGAASTMVQIDSNDVLGLGDQLRSAQADLTNLLQQMRQSPDVAQAIGRDVTAQQAALGDLISKYVYVYTMIFGQAPPGLGIAPMIIGAAVAGAVAIIVAALAVWWEKERGLNAAAQSVVLAQQNSASLIAAAEQTQDPLQKQALLQEAGVVSVAASTAATAGPQTFSDWIKANWITVAAIGGAIVIVPRLMDR